jgi:UDPglucose 6-dehydrogenase
MTRVCVVGTGYVGTVVATCLSHVGHDVIGLEADDAKLVQLQAGELPFYEPDLVGLLQTEVGSGRLRFTGDAALAMEESDVVFLCVGTPSGADGRPDMRAAADAVHAIGAAMSHPHVVITKSTVPIGTGNWLANVLEEAMARAGRSVPFTVVSNPEFLREGSAVHDFLYPDRVVIGSDDAGALDVVEDLYRPILDQSFDPMRRRATDRPALLRTSLATAETIKYASNAFLATKISFINELSGICESVGADVVEVAQGIGLDHRIGPAFLAAGIGWGGSCFGKDVSALMATAREHGRSTRILEAVVDVNRAQLGVVVEKLQQHLHSLMGRRVALLGLAFKPGTDDLRDAPSIELARRLLAAGAVLRAHDPVVSSLPEVPEVELCATPYEAAARADAVVLVTEWPQYQSLDPATLAAVMRGRLVVDGRNALDRDRFEAGGLVHAAFGRPLRWISLTDVEPGAEPLAGEREAAVAIESSR